jgi:hypothetical protein
MTICESYVDLIARLRQEQDGLRQTIAALQAEVEWLRVGAPLGNEHDWASPDHGQHDLPVSHLPQTLEDEREGY